MKYIVRKSIVQVVGHIWMPNVQAAQDHVLDSYDVDNARDDEGNITRDSVQRWLDTHAGDFSSVDDFWASIENDGDTVEIPWENEDNEFAYNDAMYPYDTEGDTQ